jgi:hypothetical protein
VELAEFNIAVRRALIDIDLEVRRALDWIVNDRGPHWQAEVRRGFDNVARTKDELSHSRTYKKIGDHAPSCEQEKRAVEMAKLRLASAEGKVEAVKRWSIFARRAVEEFQGPVQQLMGMLDSDIPKAIVLLERMSAALERYRSVSAPAAVKWEDLIGGKQSASMAQPADEISEPFPPGRGHGEGIELIASAGPLTPTLSPREREQFGPLTPALSPGERERLLSSHRPRTFYPPRTFHPRRTFLPPTTSNWKTRRPIIRRRISTLPGRSTPMR